MKIAILLSGRINSNLEQYHNFLKNCVQHHSIDLFVSHSKTEKTEVIQKFIQLYKPLKIQENNETYIDLNQYKTPFGTRIYNVLYMYQNKLNVGNMFQDYINETNQSYDIVLHSRTDLFFSKPIPYEELKHNIDNDELCIPNPYLDSNGVNDQMAIGNIDTISVYLKLYESFFELLESGVLLHPETLLMHYLNRRKVKLYRNMIEYKINRYTEEDTNPHFP